MQPKYKISSLSINFLCKTDNYYIFKRHFFYRLIGFLIKKSMAINDLNFRIGKFKEVLVKEIPYLGPRGRGYSPYERKKPKWRHKNARSFIRNYFCNLNCVRMKIVNFHSRYPYNGCKKKKIKKI